MAEQAEGEFNLRDLNDQELTEQVHDDLYNGLKAEVEEATRIFLERGWSAEKVLNDALVEGMRIVGIDFRDGILFVPEVLLAANSMKGGMEILRPLLAETGVEPIGKIVIGTVKGDIHDIGKNLVSMMLEGAGFEVIDLGINNPVEKYLAALEEHKPDILGMSALLTTTMPYMKVVIDTMKENGIRNDYIVLVGGAPLNEEFGKAVGADAYCRDAAIAVETAKSAARRAPRARTPPDDHGADVAWTRAAARSSSPAARWRARSRRCGAPTTGPHSTCAACRRNCTTGPSASRPPCARRSAPASRPLRARSSSPTATAAPAARWTRCSREEGVERLPGAHCYEFFATPRGVRGARRRRAGHVLPHRLPAAAFRPAGRSAAAGPRPPSGAQRRVLPQLPAPRLPGAGVEAPAAIERARAIADRASGFAFEYRVTGYGGAGARACARAHRRARTARHGKADHHLLARRAGAGRRQARPRDRQSAAVGALPGSGRPRGDARRQGQLGRLPRGLEAQRAARPAATTCKAEAAAEVARIEARFSDEDLEALIRAKGGAARPSAAVLGQLMYAVRHWSVRHARGLERLLPRLRVGARRAAPAVAGHRLRSASSARSRPSSASSRDCCSTAGCAGSAC